MTICLSKIILRNLLSTVRNNEKYEAVHIAITFLRTILNATTYISSSFFTALIRHRDGTTWGRIGTYFRNDNAINRRDGFYIIPSFSGSRTFGHWYLNLIHISDGRAKGFTIVSLGTSYGEEKEHIWNKLCEGFTIDANSEWNDIDCIHQTELECGARTIWNMSLLCIGLRRHIPLPLILEKNQSIDDIPREEAAVRIRREVTTILQDQSCNALFQRVFARTRDLQNTEEEHNT